MVKLEGVAGSRLAQSLFITPVHPFRVTGVSASPGQRIKVEYKEVKRGGKRAYEVRVANISETPMQYFESIVVRTNLKERPQFSIPVRAKIKRPAGRSR